MKVDLGEIFVTHLSPFLIVARVELRMNFQTGLGGCGSDQIHHDFMRLQGLAPPVLGHVTKQPMFDLVPFAGARRKMAYFDCQAGFVAQLLQFDLPKTVATTVAAAAVGGDQQAQRLRVPTPMRSSTSVLPPASMAERSLHTQSPSFF